MARSMMLLCNLGDMTIGWDPSSDSMIKPIIQKMLDLGIQFFIIRKKERHAATKVTQAMDARKIAIPDNSLQGIFATSLMTLGSLLSIATNDEEFENTGERATTPEDVIENDTAAVQQVGGG